MLNAGLLLIIYIVLLSTTVLKQLFSSNQLCILDEFELGRSEMFPSIKDAPSLEVTCAVFFFCVCICACFPMYVYVH